MVSAEVGPSEVLSLTTPYSSNKDCGRRGTWVRTVVRPGSLRSRAVAGDPTRDLSIVSRTPSRWATAPRGTVRGTLEREVRRLGTGGHVPTSTRAPALNDAAN